MFDLDEFLDQCRQAGNESEPRLAVRDVVHRAVSQPTAIADDAAARASGDHAAAPGRRPHGAERRVGAGHVDLSPRPPDVGDHRHLRGQEDNAFFRREAPGAPTLTESGGKQLTTGEVLVLGDDTIHAVTNPLDRLTAAIHVYGGDFVNQPRSQWGPGERIERPYDIAEANRQFADANAAWLGLPDNARSGRLVRC